jgi:nitroreductase
MPDARKADYPIDPQFTGRWSPRAFGPEEISEPELMTLLEAGRWAPSSYNSQPWRFAWARRGDAAWERMLGLLVPANQAWASRAAALVFLASKRTMLVRDQVVQSYSHSLDAGSAWGFIALQTHLSGWRSHGMTGVDFQRAAAELGVDDGYRLELAFAIGKPGDAAHLEAWAQAAETPNARRPLSELVSHGRFKLD